MAVARSAVTLEAVLANVVRGRVAYLVLTPEQKRALRDRDGRLALDVLRHLLGARDAIRAPERSPLVESAFQAVARKLGHEVGQKRSRLLIRRLHAAGVIVDSGQYRQPYRNSATRSGFKVALYRLGRRAALLASKAKRPVGSAPRVKRRARLRWWAHPLFGDLLQRPPPELTRSRAERMRSLDEVFGAPR